ncbi:MAG: 16S rRNA (cytidine(1402)-2'-O)-methyltransferase, partial [Verrucomicrobia bacterium]|nr:16S rRNA (cytidine(1402)-2'-O)-methyltransferase [Verrucomicrobiota bacterium]
MIPGRLFVVGTPIGNLSDLSPRAREALATADLIAAEDTRRTGLLLQHLGLKKPLLSYQKFNEASRENVLLDRLRSGQTIALVTDGGMPGISDPGERIIRAAGKENLRIEVVPGPSA